MFTEEEIKTAKITRGQIIRNDIKTLKAIYMAGEICMWDEMQPKVEKLEKELNESIKERNDLLRELGDVAYNSHDGH